MMAEQVGPTRQEPVVDSGPRGRLPVEAGVGAIHQGPGVDSSQFKAGYMSATDRVSTIIKAQPWQVRGGPYMSTESG